MCENFLAEERYSQPQLVSNRLRESLISSLIERQTACQRASLFVMDTSQGEPSQDIRSLNEIRFSFIVLGYCYFSVMKRKQFISKFWVLHGDSQYKVSQTRYLHEFWIGNYRKMGRKGNNFESWRRVYEGSVHITATGFEEHCKFWKQTLVNTWKSFTHTQAWNALWTPIYYHYWVFLR